MGCLSLYAVKRHQRGTSKFTESLLSVSDEALSKLKYSVLQRGVMTVGVKKDPITKLNLRDCVRPVALVGENRSGKTVFLSNTICTQMFPWWYQYVFPPRGLFLIGSQNFPTVDAWLKNQISSSEKKDPWSTITDLISQRRKEQRIRLFLLKIFKTKLPAFLSPQPALIIVDQAEELLRAHRAEFLLSFHNLVEKGRNNDLYRLVLVIDSENAVESLKLMNGGSMFDFIQAPKVLRESVVAVYGESFAKIFDDCDSCIGIALDFATDQEVPKDMTAKEYTAMKKEMYTSSTCLTVKITSEEYANAQNRSIMFPR